MKYMLDTNICIYAIKKSSENIFLKLKENIDEGICISAITLAELEHGIYKSLYPEKNTSALMKLLAVLSVEHFDDYAAIEYGRICAYLQKQGTPIGIIDMLIAGHARSRDYILVTNNMKEFERIPDLKLENWI